jgi:hypothetical protein
MWLQPCLQIPGLFATVDGPFATKYGIWVRTTTASTFWWQWNEIYQATKTYFGTCQVSLLFTVLHLHTHFNSLSSADLQILLMLLGVRILFTNQCSRGNNFGLTLKIKLMWIYRNQMLNRILNRYLQLPGYLQSAPSSKRVSKRVPSSKRLHSISKGKEKKILINLKHPPKKKHGLISSNLQLWRPVLGTIGQLDGSQRLTIQLSCIS